MLEAMLPSRRAGPTTEGTVIFLLTDFKTIADIVDKGPLSIPVNKGSTVTVGSDSRGNYMNFPGGNFNSVVNFGSSLMNCNEAEINLTIADYPQFGTLYGSLVFDMRPANQNGNYGLFTIINNNDTTNQRKGQISINNVGYLGKTKWGTTELINVKIKFYATRTELWMNGNLEMTTPTHLNGLILTYIGIGRHAFSSASGVNALQAKIFHFEIRKIS